MSEIVIKPDQMAVAKGEAVLITMALGSTWLSVCMMKRAVSEDWYTLCFRTYGGKAMGKMVCGM